MSDAQLAVIAETAPAVSAQWTQAQQDFYRNQLGDLSITEELRTIRNQTFSESPSLITDNG